MWSESDKSNLYQKLGLSALINQKVAFKTKWRKNLLVAAKMCTIKSSNQVAKEWVKWKSELESEMLVVKMLIIKLIVFNI